MCQSTARLLRYKGLGTAMAAHLVEDVASLHFFLQKLDSQRNSGEAFILKVRLPTGMVSWHQR